MVAEIPLVLTVLVGATVIRLSNVLVLCVYECNDKYQARKRYERQVPILKENMIDDDNCSICLDHLKEGKVRRLRCAHQFHKDCIDKWIGEGHNECPNCKSEIIQ